MTSGITSIPANSAREIGRLKAIQDNTTAQLASDTTGLLGNGDYDHFAFLTPPFKNTQIVQVGNNSGVYGTLMHMPDQHATFEDPYYSAGTAFPLDRAGSGNFGFNIARTGTPPSGYYGGDKLMVQKRSRIYYSGDESDPANTHYIYKSSVRSEAKGYVLQPDERLDGDFNTGNKPYGWTFPTDSEGNHLYNPNPDGLVGWPGTVLSVVNDPDIAPKINSVTPNFFQLPDTRLPGDEYQITLSGKNFTGIVTAYIGPFGPNFIFVSGSPGALNIIIDDSTMIINAPEGLIAGVYTVYILGTDGQIGAKHDAFTVLAAP